MSSFSSWTDEVATDLFIFITSSPSSSQSKDRAATVQQPTRSYDLYDAELDVVREKRTQNYLCSMAVVQVICITPLMVLR